MAASLTLKDVWYELRPVAPSWFRIGMLLHLPTTVLETIDKEYRKPDAKLLEVVRIWLERAGPEANWQTVVQVLKSSDHITLASQIESKYSSARG